MLKLEFALEANNIFIKNIKKIHQVVFSLYW